MKIDLREKHQRYYQHLQRHIIFNTRAEYNALIEGATGRRVPSHVSSRRNYAVQCSISCVLMLIEKRLRTTKGNRYIIITSDFIHGHLSVYHYIDHFSLGGAVKTLGDIYSRLTEISVNHDCEEATALLRFVRQLHSGIVNAGSHIR